MTREEFYQKEIGEKEYYKTLGDAVEVDLPLTYEGFEALLEVAAKEYDLPVDDRLRSLLAGYIHHIPSDEITFDYPKMCRALYKSYANSMTYEVDQKAKKRAVEEAQKANPDSNVIPITNEP
jgi:hypothetical protein